MTLSRDTTLDNWLLDPFDRRSFQRVREFVPTALITRLDGEPTILQEDPIDIGRVEFEGRDGGTTTVAKQLASSYAEGLCVIKDGRIVHEQYLNGMTPRTPHLLMSVSKSFCGALLGVQVGKGLLSRDLLVTDVAPEFAGTSLDGAQVSHVIDMTAGTEFVEDYDEYEDPEAATALLEYERHAGYRRLGAREPVGVLGHFRTYPLAQPHGSWFDYRSPLTNIAARLVEIVTDMPYPEALSRELWGPLGQEFDADIMLDPLGFPVVEGGMSCALRDLARFGLAYLQDGRSGNRQVVPQAWVLDTRQGDDAGVQAFTDSPTVDKKTHENWSMYRNAFWVLERDRVYSGLGIHGQYCYVHMPANVVIARFSTYPLAMPEDLSQETLRSLQAIAESLA